MAYVDITEHREEIEELANKTYEYKIKTRQASKKVSRESDVTIMIQGLMGEFAFSKMSGLPVNKKILLGGDGGIDFTLPGGSTLQIKFTKNPWGDLFFDPYRGYGFKADFAFLITGFKGMKNWVWVPDRCWIEREDFKECMNVRELGRGLKEVASQNQLNSLETFPFVQLKSLTSVEPKTKDEIEYWSKFEHNFDEWLAGVDAFAGSDKAPSADLFFCTGRKK
jgi:hypothetical protein